MEVKRPFDRGWGKPHPKCKKTLDEYEEVLDKRGVKIPQKKGEIDFYDEIQARGECVEIKDVIKRYKLNIKDIPKVEIEETIEKMNNMPSDWTEAQNILAKTRNTFGLLPKEERALFNNNTEEFVKSILEKDEKYNNLQNRIYPELAKRKEANQVTTTAPGVSPTNVAQQTITEVKPNEQTI